MRLRMSHLSLYLFLLATIGCGNPDDLTPSTSTASSLLDLTLGAIESQDTAAQLLGAKTIEYQILAPLPETSDEQLQSLLEINGKLGWECSPLQEKKGALRLLCKRHSSGIVEKLIAYGNKLFGKNVKEQSSRF